MSLFDDREILAIFFGRKWTLVDNGISFLYVNDDYGRQNGRGTFENYN